MKIVIDVSPLTRQKKTGIENYVFNLCKNLPLIDKKNEYILFANSYGHYQPLQKAIEEIGVKNYQNMSIKISRIPGSILNIMWKYVHIPSADILTRKEIDVFHVSNRINPPLKKAKIIVTIFDLTPLKYRKYFRKKSIQYFKYYFNEMISKADMFIAISNATKNDILSYDNINEDRVEVIPLAADSDYRKIEDNNKIKYIKQLYGLQGNYILFLGTLEPRKNIVNLIKSYNILPKDIKRDFLLVISGKKGWYYEEIFRTVRELGLEEKVVFTGYIPEEDKPALMNGAEVFVYPSFYEGFGLPPLEAMACGVPVISSNKSSIPEVIGNAGILINPDNVYELSNAIFQVLSNESLKSQLSEKSVIQAKKFSWEITARKTLEIYNKIGEIH